MASLDYSEIYRIIYGLPWIPIFVMSELIRQWFSLLTKSRVAEFHYEWQKVDIHSNSYIILFLTHYLCPDRHIQPLKQSSIAHFPIFAKGGLFWLNIVTSPQFNLWHANARHCDVIFVDCSYMRKMAQKWSTLANNNLYYQFPVTWISRLSV